MWLPLESLHLRLWPESCWGTSGTYRGQGQSSDSGLGLFMKPSRAPGLTIFLCLPCPLSIPVSQSPPLFFHIHLCLYVPHSVCPPIYLPISSCFSSSASFYVPHIICVLVSLPLHFSSPISVFPCLCASKSLSLFLYASLLPHDWLSVSHIRFQFPVSLCPHCCFLTLALGSLFLIISHLPPNFSFPPLTPLYSPTLPPVCLGLPSSLDLRNPKSSPSSVQSLT